MARPLDLRQRKGLAEFVNALFNAADYPSTAEWSRDSGYPAPNLSDLRNAKAGVDGYNLFRLIQAAAARTDTAPEELARESVDVSVASIGRDLRELTGLVHQALEHLETLSDGREPQAEEQAPADQQEDREMEA